MLRYDPKTQKVVKCFAKCGREVVINKFKANKQPCAICERKRAIEVADAGKPKLSEHIVTNADAIREAVVGTPANPRAKLANVQAVLTTHGFSPSNDGSWGCVVSDTDGSVTKIVVHIDNGMAMAPDPTPSHVSITTQKVIPFNELAQTKNLPLHVSNVLMDLAAASLDTQSSVRGEKHIVMKVCSKCGHKTPEYIIMGSRAILCVNCSGYKVAAK
jgi:hypothetical protein